MYSSLLVFSCLSFLTPQGVRVSPELPRIALGDVADFQLAGADGVVFRGNCLNASRADLYRATVDGSLIQTRLSTGSQNLADYPYLPSPDGLRVLYLSSAGLHTVPLDGSRPPLLLTSAPTHTRRFTPDSSMVLYSWDLNNLMGIPVDGGPEIVFVPLGNNIGKDFTASLDSSRVLYRIKLFNEYELHSQPITGGPSTLVTNTGTVADFKLSSNGAEILFRSTNSTARTGLYRRPYAGGAEILLSPPLVAGATVHADYAFDAGQTQALFRSNNGPEGDPDVSSELWLAPLDGSSTAVKVSAPMGVGEDVLDFRFDGAHVLYRASIAGAVELFAAPLDRSTPPVSLSAPMNAGMTVDDYVLSPDGTRALFVSNRLDPARRRAWTVPVGGGTPQELDGRSLTPAAGLVLDVPGGRVLFAAEEGTEQGLFLAPADAGTPAVRLDGPAVTGSRLTSYTASNGRALYVSTEALADTFELRSVPLDAPRTSVQLSRATSAFSWAASIGAFDVAPDGSVVVGMTDDDSPTAFSTSLTRPVPTERGLPAPAGTTLAELVFSPDSSRFVFTQRAANGTTELFGAATRGHALAQRLDFAPVTGAAHGLVIDPLSERVFYLASSAGHAAELFHSPLGGILPPEVLNEPLVSGTSVSGSVRSFSLSPDGQHLLYLADQASVNVIELHSVSSNGGPAVRLNPTLGTGEDVEEARITPDSARAVFVSDEVLDGRDNVYVAPLDGSAPALRLTDHLTGAHQVALLAFTPDGTGVIYRVRMPGAIYEIRRVSLDGSGAPLTLDGNAFDPIGFSLTPDGTRAVYHERNTAQLRSTRLDGSEPARTLQATVGPAPEAQLTPDSLHVVYIRNQFLWKARVDGSTAPVRLGSGLGAFLKHDVTPSGSILAVTINAVRTGLYELPAGGSNFQLVGNVDSSNRFLFSPRGERVLRVNGELYLDYLTRPHLPR